METKMKSTDYAKKLQVRVKILKSRRTAELAAFDKAVKAWRVAFVKWLRVKGPERVKQVTVEEIQENARYRGDLSIDTRRFFSGAPTPPRYPDGKIIRKIEGMLRHLAITGQQTVIVHSSDVEELMVDGEKED